MRTDRIRETAIAKVVGLVEEAFESRASWTEDGGLYVAEHKAAALGRDVARTLLQGQLDALGTGHCGHRRADDDPRKVFADAQRYFANNAQRMDYKRYRALGYPIGSGVVESACRHVVGVRMKRTAAMAWHEDNAEAMLQLRCLNASAAWDRFWGLDTLWQAIRSRAA